MLETGLKALIAPNDTADFFAESWPERPYVVHGLSSSVTELTSLPFLQSLNALLLSWPKPVHAHLPDAADESSAIDATPSDARKLFANKMGLLFNNVETISPVLQRWLQSLREDLGLPKSTYARCMIYATPDGKGTATHFDQNVNFVLQIHGTKTWKLAANHSVFNPTQRYTIGQPLDPELAYQAHAEMPSQMPSDYEEFVLKPGSMLFVPRGYWHSTAATGEALALNFTFSQPTWADLFTAALKSRLNLSPEWRELADGVNAVDTELRQESTLRFEGLLAELVEDIPNWSAEEILAATEGHVLEEDTDDFN